MLSKFLGGNKRGGDVAGTGKDSAQVGDVSSIRIPRTALGLGFGEKYTNSDLIYAVEREPYAFKMVFQVAQDMFDKWFEVKDPRKDDQDKELNANVQTELSKLKAQSIFTDAAVHERGLGWSIMVVGYEDEGETLEDPAKDPESIKDLAVYSPFQIGSRIQEDEEPDSKRYGLPVLYPVRRAPKAKLASIHYSCVIHFATRLLKHRYKGVPVTGPCWDDLTSIRNCRWGVAQTLYRYGGGFPVVTIDGADKEGLQEFANYWGPLTARTSLFKNEKQKIEFMGLQGRALNPENYILAIMDELSAGSGIPRAILRGAQAGALTGSEVNEREYFKVVSDAQKRFEPGVRFLIDQLIKIKQVETSVKPGEYEVEWVGAFEINPRDRMAAFYDESRARALQTDYLTVNEIRAQMDPPLDEVDGGDVVLGLLKAQAAKAQAATAQAELYAAKKIEAANKNKRLSRRKAEIMKKFGKPVEYVLADRIAKGASVKKICKDLSITQSTFYNWKDEYGLH